MSRAVTADHVLFDECIEVFRREKNDFSPFFTGESHSFLLTPFEINIEWDLGICKVQPSIKFGLPGAYSAFINKVKNPDWVGSHNPHLFGIALATVVSAITLKVCKSTRDGYLCRQNELSENDIHQLAILHPILTAGPGATHSNLSIEKQKQMQDQIATFISKLMALEYKNYWLVMQNIRLIHLSLLSKRDDFGLAYQLAISAIEVMAQKAIAEKAFKRGIVNLNDPNEQVWKEKAEVDPDFKALLEAYREARGKNKYLRERFVRFLLQYAPVDQWVDYVDHPQQDMADYIKELNPSHNLEYVVKKNWSEKYPDDLDKNEIESILSNAYVHRSNFVHRGKQPPHKDPNPSFNRFFQEFREYDGSKVIEVLLPNYELLLALAKYSLLNWIDEKK